MQHVSFKFCTLISDTGNVQTFNGGTDLNHHAWSLMLRRWTCSTPIGRSSSARFESVGFRWANDLTY